MDLLSNVPDFWMKNFGDWCIYILLLNELYSNDWQKHTNKIARFALNPVHNMDIWVILHGATFSLMLKIYLREEVDWLHR